jgi:galactokinase
MASYEEYLERLKHQKRTFEMLFEDKFAQLKNYLRSLEDILSNKKDENLKLLRDLKSKELQYDNLLKEKGSVNLQENLKKLNDLKQENSRLLEELKILKQENSGLEINLELKGRG